MLKDREGYEHPYDMQLCEQCRTSDHMTEEEIKQVALRPRVPEGEW